MGHIWDSSSGLAEKGCALFIVSALGSEGKASFGQEDKSVKQEANKAPSSHTGISKNS